LQELDVHDELVTCDEPTGSSIILITPDSERTMNTYLGANRFYSASDVDQDSVRSCDYFHFTGYMWDTPSQKESIKLALRTAAESGVKVSFDIADPLAVGRNRDEFLRLITEHVDVVFANSEEARILFDNYDAYECCKSMGKLCGTAIVKNGKQGSFVSHGNKVIRIPVQGPQKPVDTTGAGDIYAAGFLYGLCKGLSTEESGHAASYLAGEIIQQRGAQFSPEKARMVRSMLEHNTFLRGMRDA
jgi:sugar/nucleoside kinase (ribokinase family)